MFFISFFIYFFINFFISVLPADALGVPVDAPVVPVDAPVFLETHPALRAYAVCYPFVVPELSLTCPRWQIRSRWKPWTFPVDPAVLATYSHDLPTPSPR